MHSSSLAGRVVEVVQVFCGKCDRAGSSPQRLHGATEFFREEGWRCVDGRWLCPDCVPVHPGEGCLCPECKPNFWNGGL
jgi:hypothetical protein